MTVEAMNRDDAVVISVADQGPGVPEPQLAKIFDPFYRVDDSPAPGTGGIGLGLAIARAIQLHQGTITAANAIPVCVSRSHCPCSRRSPRRPTSHA